MSPAIPESVIASVKANTSFLSLLKKYGIEARRTGKDYKTFCPFHQVDGHTEKEPSLSIDPATNLYHCFSCNSKGNVIQFVQAMESISFPRAVERLLAIKSSQRSDAGRQLKEKDGTGKTEIENFPEEERQAMLREVIKTTTEALRTNEAGRKYLEDRGLNPLKLLESHSFGFWNGRLYDKLDGSERRKLQTVGLLNGNKALFENCIVFPMIKDGRIATIYGRKISSQPSAISTQPEKTESRTLTAESSSGRPFDSAQGRHYLLPCKREGLFLPNAGLNPRKPVIITESVIDGLSLFVAGITNVLPLLGVNGFLPDHLDYLKGQSFPMIYLALNGDEAGNKAAAQLRQNLIERKLPAEIIQLPDGKDINDMLKDLGETKLKEWFTEKSCQRSAGRPEKPTVWEDEAGDTIILLDNREYRIRGLSVYGMDRLKVNVKAYAVDNRNNFYVDTLDLYQSKNREHLITQIAKTLDVEITKITHDVNSLITVLEELRLSRKDKDDGNKHYVMSDEERREALEYLRSPDLLERIARDFEACGMIGNHDQKLIAYLGALSRLTDRPFGILIVSRSGAGKSYLQEMVADFTPEESLLRMTRLTGQSLFYQGKEGLRHKLLTIEEDEGMQEAMYSIRTLLSSQKLSLHGLKTDPKTGEFKAYDNMVEGPASVMISTTNLSSFTFENVNRFFVLFLDESRRQTTAILEHQKLTSGLEKIKFGLTRKRLMKLHRNIQRLLKPIAVVNKLGTGITYPAEILNTRRENTKTEALIETLTLLHQYQREIKNERVYGVDTQYIEVAKEDVEAVHRIAGEILAQSLSEMSKLCRELLEHIHALVNEKYREAAKLQNGLEYWQISITRKELQERSRWSRWHLEEHLKELEEAGYIVHRLGKKGQRYAYGLLENIIPEMPQVNKSI